MSTEVTQRDDKGRFMPNNTLGFALGNAGRPPKYTPQEWETRVAEYFATCNTEERPYTWAGLCLFMGMSKEGLDNWLKGEYEGRGDKSVYVDCLKAARTAIECQREELLIKRESGNIAGIIFALKQYGWRDEKHLSVESQQEQRLIVQLPPELATRLQSSGAQIEHEIIEGEYSKG